MFVSFLVQKNAQEKSQTTLHSLQLGVTPLLGHLQPELWIKYPQGGGRKGSSPTLKKHSHPPLDAGMQAQLLC